MWPAFGLPVLTHTHTHTHLYTLDFNQEYVACLWFAGTAACVHDDGDVVGARGTRNRRHGSLGRYQ